MATGSKTLFDAAMELQASDIPNLRQAVPFFNVKDIETSLRFYVDGLAFTITRRWNPDGRIRWCWLERDGVAIMLQEYWKDGQPGRQEKLKNEKLYDSHKSFLHTRKFACLNSFRCKPGANGTGEAGRRLERYH